MSVPLAFLMCFPSTSENRESTHPSETKNDTFIFRVRNDAYISIYKKEYGKKHAQIVCACMCVCVPRMKCVSTQEYGVLSFKYARIPCPLIQVWLCVREIKHVNLVLLHKTKYFTRQDKFFSCCCLCVFLFKYMRSYALRKDSASSHSLI